MTKKPEIHEYVAERDVIVKCRYIVHATSPEMAKRRISRMANLELLPTPRSETVTRKGHWKILNGEDK